jgi:hypothetical protein
MIVSSQATSCHAVTGAPSFTWFGIEVLRYPEAILLQLRSRFS